MSSFEDKLMGNPVGWLQELCMSRFWPPPSYHAENDDNVNRRKLTISISICLQFLFFKYTF